MKEKQAKIRVAFFDHTAALGGGELSLAELVKRFDPNRVQATVLLGARGPLQDLLQDHVPVQLLPMSPRVQGMAKASVGLARLEGVAATGHALLYVLRLAKLLRAQGFEIIHTNSLKACVLGGLAGRLAGCQVVWHIRDRIADDYLPVRAVRCVRMAARLLPHHVIANSKATLKTLHLKSTPSAVIHSGVDLSKFQPLPRQRKASSKRIGLIGRICPWKGQHIFIEAAHKVYQADPSTSFQIIGAALFGESDYELECRAMVQRYNLEEVLEFTGFQDDVASAMSALDMVVHASVLGEPFGQVIVQGMASGKPVVATDGGGVPEIIEHGETGLLVKMGDAEEMAAAMLSLLADPDRARLMAERGRQRVEEHFSIEANAHQVMGVYEVTVASRR